MKINHWIYPQMDRVTLFCEIKMSQKVTDIAWLLSWWQPVSCYLQKKLPRIGPRQPPASVTTTPIPQSSSSDRPCPCKELCVPIFWDWVWDGGLLHFGIDVHWCSMIFLWFTDGFPWFSHGSPWPLWITRLWPPGKLAPLGRDPLPRQLSASLRPSGKRIT